MQGGCHIWVNETDLLKVAESTLKLWRNWLGLREALSISGVEDPSRLIRAISTSSTVMGWVWNLALFSFLLAGRLETDGRLTWAEGGGRLVRGVAGLAGLAGLHSSCLTLSLTEVSGT